MEDIEGEIEGEVDSNDDEAVDGDVEGEMEGETKGDIDGALEGAREGLVDGKGVGVTERETSGSLHSKYPFDPQVSLRDTHVDSQQSPPSQSHAAVL